MLHPIFISLIGPTEMNNSSWYAHVHTHINAYKYNCMHTHIHVCCSIQKIYTAGEKWFSIRRRQSSSGTTRIRTRVSQGQTTCLLINHLSCSGSILQTWTGQPVPMMSEHSAHLTPLSRLTENKARQFDPFVVIAGTVSCRNDNLECHQLRQSWQIDHLLYSVGHPWPWR